MRTAAYITASVMTAMSIACIAMGGTHHVATLGISIMFGLIAWSTRNEDNDIVEFKE
jgi:hypothetical protein